MKQILDTDPVEFPRGNPIQQGWSLDTCWSEAEIPSLAGILKESFFDLSPLKTGSSTSIKYLVSRSLHFQQQDSFSPNSSVWGGASLVIWRDYEPFY